MKRRVMQHLKTVLSWKFRLLQSNLGHLHLEWLQTAYSPMLSELRSSSPATSCKARMNIQASIQSKKSVSPSLTVIMVFREIFFFLVVYTFLESEVKLQDTHHVFNFHLSYPFSDLGDTTRCWHHQFLILIAFTSYIHSKDT